MNLTESEIKSYFNSMKSRGHVNSNMEFDWFREYDTDILIGYHLVESREKSWWKRYTYKVSKSTIQQWIRQSKLDKLID